MVDGIPLLLDSMMYINEAGESFGVSLVEYYLSELVLMGTGDTPNDTIHGPWYIDAASTTGFHIGHLTPGTYSGASLLLGLPPSLNISGALPNTLENINMAWPDPMGGGYHFMKFEGHFISGGDINGFAMHIGGNAFLPVCTAEQDFTITGSSGTLQLTFNLNEVFRGPHAYSLADGNYSMGDPVLMGMLKENIADAFTIQFLP